MPRINSNTLPTCRLKSGSLAGTFLMALAELAEAAEIAVDNDSPARGDGSQGQMRGAVAFHHSRVSSSDRKVMSARPPRFAVPLPIQERHGRTWARVSFSSPWFQSAGWTARALPKVGFRPPPDARPVILQSRRRKFPMRKADKRF